MKRPFSSFVLALFSIPAVLLIVVACVVERGDDVIFINSHNNAFLDAMFSFVTIWGEGLLFLPLIVCCLFIQFRYSVMAAVVWVTHSALCQLLKRGIFHDVHRPISILDKSKLHFVPHVEVHGLYSFPSGHTATIFCLAMLMALLLRRKTPAVIFMLIALLVGYSRIYLLQHFLVDVAGGAVVGIALTYCIWKIFERDTLPQWMTHALANPLSSLLKQTSRKNHQKPAGI